MRSLKAISMSVATVLALSATVAFAQRDAGAKIRGEFGVGFQNSARAAMVYGYRGGPAYVAPAPVAAPVPAPAAPPQLAENLTSRRAFSVEPNATACPPAAPSIAVAPGAPTVRRSYSYEPAATYSFRSPAYRTNGARTPSYMLPKTDARKYGGW